MQHTCSNCTNCNCHDTSPRLSKLIFSSNIQDIYEFTTLGLRFVINKFTVGEHLNIPVFCEDKNGLAGSYHITSLLQDWYCTQENKKYKQGTYLYKSCVAIPTEDKSKWGYNIISLETTLIQDEIDMLFSEVKKIIASYIFTNTDTEAAS